MVDELVSLSAAAAPKMKLFGLLLRVTVPVPLSVRPDTPMINSVTFPPEFRLIWPLLVMLPSAVRIVLFTTFRTSPTLLKVRVPKVPLTFRFTLAVVVPMVTASALVGTPALQLLAVPQLLSPPAPFQVSLVSGGGGALGIVRRAATMLVAGCSLNNDFGESLRFDRAADCAAASPFRLETVASRQMRVLQTVTTRESRGRMETP